MVLNSAGSTCTTVTAASEVGVEKAEDEPDDTWKLAPDEVLAINDGPFLGRCVYRGEGNANLVLAIPSERKVVRFRKSLPGEASSDGGLDRITREIEFLRSIISGLLGDYVHLPEAVRGNPEDMVRLSEAIRPLRPKNRCAKEIVEEYATKYVDYTFLPAKMSGVVQQHQHQHQQQQLRTRPTFSVEIKPKQGFRHELDQRFEKCTYCLTQYYKLKIGAIQSRSGYCPFDLFSGETERMKKSLRGLLESPQNNFKIFKNGVIVYDSNSRFSDLENIFAEWFTTCSGQNLEQYFEVFFRLIRTALLREFPHSCQLKTLPHRPLTRLFLQDYKSGPRIDPELVSRTKQILYFLGEECNFDGGELPRGSVLERVHYMQQLPYHSADAVFEIYSRHLATLNDHAVYSHLINTHHREKQTELLVRNGKTNGSLFDKSGHCPDPKFNTGANYSDSRARALSTSRSRLSESNTNEDDERTPLDLWNNNSYQGDADVNAENLISVEEIEALQNYLLVTTAKDCAIIMAFEELDTTGRPDVPEDYVVEATDQLKFLVNVGVLDLDSKSIHCVNRHRVRDEKVLIALERTFEEEEIGLMNGLPIDDQN